MVAGAITSVHKNRVEHRPTASLDKMQTSSYYGVQCTVGDKMMSANCGMPNTLSRQATGQVAFDSAAYVFAREASFYGYYYFYFPCRGLLHVPLMGLQ